jgi:hypothetical protein
MAEVLLDRFNSYTDGSIFGQGGWADYSGGGNGTVTVGTEGAVSGKGMKVVSGTTSAHAGKQFTALTTSTVVFDFKRPSSYAGSEFDLYFYQQGLGSYCLVGFRTDGTVWMYNGTGWATTGLSYSVDTLYTIKAEFDKSNSRYRVSLDNGSNWSGYATINAAQARFDQIGFGGAAGSSETTYIDNVYVDDALGASRPAEAATSSRKIRGMGITR